jgi:hypothetical protein
MSAQPFRDAIEMDCLSTAKSGNVGLFVKTNDASSFRRSFSGTSDCSRFGFFRSQ